eukprot:m.160660 g.160660  ORF g.160660 m.160660 type:complete len:712 (+) comp11977_c0_seq1:139-2274(+)
MPRTPVAAAVASRTAASMAASHPEAGRSPSVTTGAAQGSMHTQPAAGTRTLLWFRNDLRLTDNAIVAEAVRCGGPCLPVYVADPAIFGARSSDTLGSRSRCGPHRARFVLEAVTDLRARLRAVGSDLLVVRGSAATAIPALLSTQSAGGTIHGNQSGAPPSDVATQNRRASRGGTDGTAHGVRVLVTEEPCTEEVAEVQAVKEAIASSGGVVDERWQRTLYHRDDLPSGADIASITEASARAMSFQFTSWRKRLESSLGPGERGIRRALPAPTAMPPLWETMVSGTLPSPPPGVEWGFEYVPTLSSLGVPATLREVLTGSVTDQAAGSDTTHSRGDDDALAVVDAGCMADDGLGGRFVGGETAALDRLNAWVYEQNGLASYLDTRNGMLGAGYSSKFSPWLATGALSPRTIMEAKTSWEARNGASKSSYWLYFELLWRDWFTWVALISGPRLFCPRGPLTALPSVRGGGGGGGGKGRHGYESGEPESATTAWRPPIGGWKGSESDFVAWVEGRTGWPLVDAAMRELAASGFMSNRARQNVASFLALELGCDWRLGALWFEACLIDHDPASNYGNWAAAAGLTGGRLNRFNMLKQSKDYDAGGAFVRRWVPELRQFPDTKIHAPWTASLAVMQRADCVVGAGPDAAYPSPMKSTFEWPAKQDHDGHHGGQSGGKARSKAPPRRRTGGGPDASKWTQSKGRRRETGKNSRHLA